MSARNDADAEVEDESYELQQLLHALAPNAEEKELLLCICDEQLREMLLHMLLRAPYGEPVPIEVNDRMNESDSFTCTLSEILENGSFIPATLSRIQIEEGGEAKSYKLACAELPQLNKMYKGDDVVDHLLQYFAKDLIRFPGSQENVSRASSLALGALFESELHGGIVLVLHT